MKYLYFSFSSLLIFCWQTIISDAFLCQHQFHTRLKAINQKIYNSPNQDQDNYQGKNTTKFMIFNNNKRELSEEEIAKGRPREAYRNITYNPIDDIEAEDLFEKFQKLLNESEGHQQRMYVNRIHHEILAQNRRIKEKREPHVRVFHFNETEEEENMKKDEEAAEKLKEDLERNLGVRVFLRKNGQQNNA